MFIRHDTRYKLAALTAELWGRGHDIDGVEEADAAALEGAAARKKVPPDSGRVGRFPHCVPSGTSARRRRAPLPLTSQELLAMPLAWSHESHSCPRIP